MRWLTFLALTPVLIGALGGASPSEARPVRLAPDLPTVLRSALLDEQAAEAYYEAVMLKYGPVRPFANVVRSERMHADLVIQLMRRHGVSVPKNPHAQRPKETDAAFIARWQVPPTFALAAERAVDLELAQVPFYESLMHPTLPADVRQVFTKLLEDSRDRHAVAFGRVGSRMGGRGPGPRR